MESYGDVSTTRGPLPTLLDEGLLQFPGPVSLPTLIRE